MRRITIICAFLLGLCGCGDDSSDVLLWGDTCQQFTDAWCDLNRDCGFAATEACNRHVYHHCCELFDNCGEEATAEQEAALEECLPALNPEDANCTLVYWGFTPEVCWPYMEQWNR